jgi:hypothetical protein
MVEQWVGGEGVCHLRESGRLENRQIAQAATLCSVSRPVALAEEEVVMIDVGELEWFVVRAKRASYVGDGERALPSREGAHDLTFAQGEWSYRDSYFGGTDFIGQEVVWHMGEPVWAMNYYGYILRPELIDAVRAGETIKGALSALYAEGRFLGGFEWSGSHGIYRDGSAGDVAHFHGRETISVGELEAYVLDYAGGLVKA